jgi:hypothetical protein
MSVVVDVPAFGPSTIDTVAPVTSAEVFVPVTLPLSENVVAGLGDGEGDVEVPLLLVHAHVQANAASRTKQPRWTVGMNAPSRA